MLIIYTRTTWSRRDRRSSSSNKLTIQKHKKAYRFSPKKWITNKFVCVSFLNDNSFQFHKMYVRRVSRYLRISSLWLITMRSNKFAKFVSFAIKSWAVVKLYRTSARPFNQRVLTSNSTKSWKIFTQIN